MWVQSLGQEEPLEDSMATLSSIFAWRIPWTEEPGGLQSIVSQRVGDGGSDLTCTHARVMATTPLDSWGLRLLGEDPVPVCQQSLPKSQSVATLEVGPACLCARPVLSDSARPHRL